MVRIGFNLSLIDRIGKSELKFEPARGQSLVDFLKDLGIPQTELGMVMADGRWRNIDEVILDNYSNIDVFPHLEGG